MDTNVLISAFFWSNSVPTSALKKATDRGTLIFSSATLTELINVINRAKFEKYIKTVPTKTFIFNLLECSEIVEISNPIQACRDPRDDIFLEAAVNGNADFIVTGDEDLLVMHPFQGITICTPTEFLNHAKTSADH